MFLRAIFVAIVGFSDFYYTAAAQGGGLFYNNPFLYNVLPIGPPHHQQSTFSNFLHQQSTGINQLNTNEGHSTSSSNVVVIPGIQRPLNVDSKNVNSYDYSHNPFLANVSTQYVSPTQLATTTVQVTQRPVENPSGYTFAPPGTDLLKYCLKPRGQFPAKYCNAFVNCWDGIVIVQFCPEPLLFHPIKYYCDYPSNIDCQGRPITAYPIYPSQNTSSDGSWVPDINLTSTPATIPILPPPLARPPLPPPYVPGRPIDNFPPGLPVNPVPPVAPVPPYVPGGLPIAPSNDPIPNPPYLPTIPPITLPPPSYRPTLPTSPIPIVPAIPIVSVPPVQQDPTPTSNPYLKKYCLKPRGQFPSTACNKYVNCWDDVVIEQECPQGLLFSPIKCYCDFPYNVVCKPINEKVKNQIVIDSKSTKKDPSCQRSEGTFREADCTSYYVCSNHQVVAKYKCPEGYKFNTVTGVCDHEQNVDCNSVNFQLPITNLIKQIPAALIDATVKCTEGKVYRLNDQCTSVSICRKNIAEIVHCPPGFAYDINSDKCLLANVAKC